MSGSILIASMVLLLPTAPLGAATPIPEACTIGARSVTAPATAACSSNEAERTEEEFLTHQAVGLLQMAFASSADESQVSEPARVIGTDAVGASQQQVPDLGSIGGLVNNVASAVTDTAKAAIDSTANAVAQAAANQVTGLVNSTLQALLDRVDSLLVTVVEESNTLVESVQSANPMNRWRTFMTDVEKTLTTDLAAWQSVPWTSITNINQTLSTFGLDGIIPSEMLQALLQAVAFEQAIENATELVKTLKDLPQNLTAEPLAQLNAILESDLQKLEGLEDSMVASIANLMQSATTKIAKTFPSAPVSILAGVNQSLATVEGTAASLGDKVYKAASAIVSGIGEATTLAEATPATAPAPAHRSMARSVAPGSLGAALVSLLVMWAAYGHC